MFKHLKPYYMTVLNPITTIDVPLEIWEKLPKQVYKGYNQRDNHIPKYESSQQQFFERKPRVIVDKEKEIFSNSLTFDKERIVNDIIFSEILSKPKSKR